ncbi:MAG: ABC transporter permease [bacterium]|nr:ABC transporter permease [bacterium]
MPASNTAYPKSRRSRLLKSRAALHGIPKLPLLVVLVTIFLAVFGEAVAPHGPTTIDLINARLPPFWAAEGSTQFLLGTDELGRDVLSRIIGGARVSLGVAIVTIAVGGIIGTALGIWAGYARGLTDVVIMRIVDGFLAFPAILIALVFSVTVGPGFGVVVLVLALMLWSRYARLIRGEVLSLRDRDFVNLARVAGASPLRIVLVHIFPNVLSTFLVLSTLQVGWAITVEATLSFLGAGVPPPDPTWGGMVAGGQALLRKEWWVSVFPGAAIGVVVLSFNLLGDWIRDALDPKLRQL